MQFNIKLNVFLFLVNLFVNKFITNILLKYCFNSLIIIINDSNKLNRSLVLQKYVYNKLNI